uniref:Retrotransposon protein, putative, Ty3-gypsy subclass n=1 Tax=Oryza sativa subsp. japonica TaxID=39947 RepID=Q2QVW0_ORYSJ|nr:retrotransposon protein, putative, Ty3-gypsy subclass [Oryza sativa Japonica Group]
MAWTQPSFDLSMAAPQASLFVAGVPNTVVQPHMQAMTSPFATPYPQTNGPSQQANSIYSWEQLRDIFVPNFRGTYEEPKMQQHLLGIRQRPGESIREYMRRFSQARCQVQDITEASVINAASAGLLGGELTRKITNKEPQTLEHLLRIIDGKFRNDRTGKAVMAIEEVQALRKEFDAQQAVSNQQPVRKKRGNAQDPRLQQGAAVEAPREAAQEQAPPVEQRQDIQLGVIQVITRADPPVQQSKRQKKMQLRTVHNITAAGQGALRYLN